MHSPQRRTARGFTLIELLTVIAIIGILAAILIPTVGRVRATARNAQCVSNLRQIALATLLYADANKDRLPFGYTAGGGQWHLQIEPYFGNPRSGWNTISNPILTCPTATNPPVESRSSYAANPRVMGDGQQSTAVQVMRSSLRRPSETVLAGDAGGQAGGNANWGFISQDEIYNSSSARADDPMPDNSAKTDSGVIRWRHDGRANFGFADGHAKGFRVGEAKFRHFQINY
jgi:prepilin-type N-terminal cleavage/methylation domain-containing protein/prepilin-type processing-associated H-X9-DG protein